MMSVKKSAALFFSAAFAYSGFAFSQVEVVELNTATPEQPALAEQEQPAPSQQGELFYQLQLLQQEIMQLRGAVEEQGHQLQRLKQQSMERYIDLDRRIGGGVAASEKPAISAPVAAPRTLPVSAQAGEKEAYSAAYNLVTSKQFEQALDTFKQFLVDYPNGQYAGNSYYWLGELYQVISPQNLEASRQAFSQLLQQFPNHAKAPDAMYKLGKVYFLKGNKVKSRQRLEAVTVQYRDSSAATKAAQFLKDNF
jgi:tol-pal system protein YbgF